MTLIKLCRAKKLFVVVYIQRYKLHINRDVFFFVISVYDTLSVIFAEADSFDQFQIFPSSIFV